MQDETLHGRSQLSLGSRPLRTPRCPVQHVVVNDTQKSPPIHHHPSYNHPMVQAVVFEQLANRWELQALSSRFSRNDSSCVRRCANGINLNSLRADQPPETRSPSHVPLLMSTLHPRVLGNRLQILPMYTDGRWRPTCEWHRGGDDSMTF